MQFSSESELENHLRKLISEAICNIDQNILMLESKTLSDIIICRNGQDPCIKFIEIKHLKENMGRLGVGGKNGIGFQPEVLKRQPTYFETNLIWILFSEKHEFNSEYLIETTKDLNKMYAQGGRIGNKYNGIKQSIFGERKKYTETELVEYLKCWVNS